MSKIIFETDHYTVEVNEAPIEDKDGEILNYNVVNKETQRVEFQGGNAPQVITVTRALDKFLQDLESGDLSEAKPATKIAKIH